MYREFLKSINELKEKKIDIKKIGEYKHYYLFVLSYEIISIIHLLDELR